MVPLALGLFIAVFVYGASLLGWSDPDSKVRLGLTEPGYERLALKVMGVSKLEPLSP